MTPEGPYGSGQMRYHNSAESTKLLIDALHARGIACAFYTKLCTAGGKAGYELYRRHPDWLVPGFFDMAQLDRGDRDDNLISWPQLSVPREKDAPFRYHAQEIVRSIDAFGWTSRDLDSAMEWLPPEVTQLVKDTVARVHPQFQWGYNMNILGVADHPILPVLCAGRGHGHGGSQPQRRPRPLAVRAVRAAAHRNAGHRASPRRPPGDHRHGEQDGLRAEIFQEVLLLASQAHPAWGTRNRFNAFATRYADLLWDNRCTGLNAPEQWIEWGESVGPLYKWGSFVALRRPFEGRTELIYAPDRSAARGPCWLVRRWRRGAARVDLPCAVRVPAGLTVRDVRCVTPEAEPWQAKLPFELKDGRLRLTVPRLRFWDVVVARFDGAPAWTQ